MQEGIDTEYLITLINQVRWQNNGITNEIADEKVKLKGINVGETGEKFVSFEYLQEKSSIIDSLLNTIEKDILLKSGRFRSMEN